MTDVSFIIPVAEYHQQVAERAIESVRAQSVPSTILTITDTESKGPAYLRNMMLMRVTTPYVVFLDADDWVTADFTEKCLAAMQPRHYVYTDWYQGDEVKVAPETPWDGTGAWHVITALLRTDDARSLGGFDTSLPAAEDTAFYWALTRSGVLGVHVHEPLFHYGPEGQRARQFVANQALHDDTMARIVSRYQGLPSPYEPPPECVNDPFAGSVLVTCTWDGKQARRGRATGILYPKSGWGKRMWVHPEDAALEPGFFRRVDEPTFGNPFSPQFNGKASEPLPSTPPPRIVAEGIEGVAAALFPQTVGREQKRKQAEAEALLVAPTVVSPDVARVIELFDRANKSA